MPAAQAQQAINISDFRASIATYMKQANQGETIAITSGSEVMANLIAPINQRQQAKNKLQALTKTAIIGDIESPCGQPWAAMA